MVIRTPTSRTRTRCGPGPARRTGAARVGTAPEPGGRGPLADDVRAGASAAQPWTAAERQRASSFDRRDVICAFAAAARQGATVEEIEAFADSSLADSRVVALVPGGQGNLSHRDALRLDDGRAVPAMGHATRYTTRELLALEREVIDRALGERAVGAAVAEPAAVERAIATCTGWRRAATRMARRSRCAPGVTPGLKSPGGRGGD
jgi:hypothetical protein